MIQNKTSEKILSEYVNGNWKEEHKPNKKISKWCCHDRP